MNLSFDLVARDGSFVFGGKFQVVPIDSYCERDGVSCNFTVGNRKFKIGHGDFSSHFITLLFQAEEQSDLIATEVELVVPIPGDAGRSWRGVGGFFLTFGLPIQSTVLATV